MAGAGYKLFNTGDVLTAAQVNTYLMEQTVMVFANAAARTTALSGVVSEGMISYLKDTNAVEVYDGSNWVSSDDPNAIQNTIVDAKGDLITATASDVPARLAVGNNGESLVADSSATTGLRYTAGTVQGNPVINSAFQIWQRGTSVAASAGSSTYTADRWSILSSGNATTTSRQSTSDTTNLPFIQYCARVQRNAGQTSTQNIFFGNSFETINALPYAGKTVTLSYYARAGANFSAASNNLTVLLYSGTGTDQSITVTYTGASAVITNTQPLTTTWQRFSATGTISASATEIAISTQHTPSGTAGANDWFEITGVQIDVGSVALPFRTYSATLAGELAACQRYYYSFVSGTNLNIGLGANLNTTTAVATIAFPVTMRTAPTLSASSGTNYYTFERSLATDDFNSFTISRATTTSATIYNNSEISGTTGVAGLIYTNNASASIAFTSEL